MRHPEPLYLRCSRHISRSILLLILLAASTSLLTAQQPEVSLHVSVSPIPTPFELPEPYRTFDGLYLEEVTYSDIVPLLPFIFFDSGSSDIPERYHLFDDPSEIESFSPSRLMRKLDNYYDLLNIIGYRMREYPSTTITIQGRDSQRPDIGENYETSSRRAGKVYDYLVNIWRIDPERIIRLKDGSFPLERSSSNDPLGFVEKQRVEIRSNNWEIVRPLGTAALQTFYSPSRLSFDIDYKGKEPIVSRELFIYMDRRVRVRISERSPFPSETMRWEWPSDPYVESRRLQTASFSAEVILHLADGRTVSSEPTPIPSLVMSAERMAKEKIPTRSFYHFPLIDFKFDSDETTYVADTILANVIAPAIRPGSEVSILGMSDIIGLEDRNLRLSQRRAQFVADRLRSMIAASTPVSFTVDWLGERGELYSNDLPEGRFYNRTVVVTVENRGEE